MKRLVVIAVIVLGFIQPAPVLAREVFRHQLNERRERAGLHTLRASRTLFLKARAHAEEMALDGRISHRGFTKRMMADGLRDHGEVVAYMGGVIVQPRRVLGLFMGSPPHHEILMKASARVVGVAAVRHRGAVYWCAITAHP